LPVARSAGPPDAATPVAAAATGAADSARSAEAVDGTFSAAGLPEAGAAAFA
jgi:hypothetical protein